MRLLVFNIQDLEASILFHDERLENLRRLMDMGCFGGLAGAAEWDVLARQENHTLNLMEFFQQAGRKCAGYHDFASLVNRIQTEDWDYCLLTAVSAPTDGKPVGDYLELDRELGEVLQYLSDDTIITTIGRDCFVLVSANNPISGEYKDGSAADIAPTLLELSGYPLPASVEGRSWVQGMELKSTSGLTAEEEEILRDRLSGLGYI